MSTKRSERKPDETVTATLRGPIVIAAPPDPVSQLCAESVGLTRRTYLESLTEYEQSGGHVGRHGKLRLVRREPYTAWLMSRQASAAEPRDGAAAVLAEMGLQVQS